MSLPFHTDPPSIVPLRAREIVIQAACKLKVESEFDAWFVAVPNGTWTPSIKARVRAKREGASKGFPDALIVGHGRNAGKIAFVEIKAGSSLSHSQKDWLTELHKNGFQCGMFRSEITLANKLTEWGWK